MTAVTLSHAPNDHPSPRITQQKQFLCCVHAHTSHYTSDFTLYNPPAAQALATYTTAKTTVSTTIHLV
jgi:hypothetical protein